MQMCDEWLENMDNGKLNIVIFPDIKKAFDSLNHGILLNKTKKHFGISSIEIKSSNAVLSEQLSSKKTITIGVPQGLFLGPLLILYYILIVAFLDPTDWTLDSKLASGPQCPLD